jgi:addiction module HigA family antidote
MPPSRRSTKISPSPKNLRQLIKHRLAPNRPPTHPGETLLEEYLKPWGMTANAFAKRMGVSTSRLTSIIRGQRDIVAEDALRLARVLGTKADYWLNLQHSWNLWHTMQGSSGRAIAKLRPITKKASRSLVAKAMQAEKQLEAAARKRLRPLMATSGNFGKRFVKGVRDVVGTAPTVIRRYRMNRKKQR